MSDDPHSLPHTSSEKGQSRSVVTVSTLQIDPEIVGLAPTFVMLIRRRNWGCRDWTPNLDTVGHPGSEVGDIPLSTLPLGSRVHPLICRDSPVGPGEGSWEG